MKHSIQKFILFSFAFTLLMGIGCKSSSETKEHKTPSWFKLGERAVDFKGDHDVIVVTADKGKFSAVKLKVLRAPIFLNSATITYANGETHRMAINKRIPAGSTTKTAQLPGGARFIKKFTFNYRTAPRATSKALIILYGKR